MFRVRVYDRPIEWTFAETTQQQLRLPPRATTTRSAVATVASAVTYVCDAYGDMLCDGGGLSLRRGGGRNGSYDDAGGGHRRRLFGIGHDKRQKARSAPPAGSRAAACFTDGPSGVRAADRRGGSRRPRVLWLAAADDADDPRSATMRPSAHNNGGDGPGWMFVRVPPDLDVTFVLDKRDLIRRTGGGGRDGGPVGISPSGGSCSRSTEPLFRNATDVGRNNILLTTFVCDVGPLLQRLAELFHRSHARRVDFAATAATSGTDDRNGVTSSRVGGARYTLLVRNAQTHRLKARVPVSACAGVTLTNGTATAGAPATSTLLLDADDELVLCRTTRRLATCKLDNDAVCGYADPADLCRNREPSSRVLVFGVPRELMADIVFWPMSNGEPRRLLLAGSRFTSIHVFRERMAREASATVAGATAGRSRGAPPPAPAVVVESAWWWWPDRDGGGDAGDPTTNGAYHPFDLEWFAAAIVSSSSSSYGLADDLRFLLFRHPSRPSSPSPLNAVRRRDEHGRAAAVSSGRSLSPRSRAAAVAPTPPPPDHIETMLDVLDYAYGLVCSPYHDFHERCVAELRSSLMLLRRSEARVRRGPPGVSEGRGGRSIAQAGTPKHTGGAARLVSRLRRRFATLGVGCGAGGSSPPGAGPAARSRVAASTDHSRMGVARLLFAHRQLSATVPRVARATNASPAIEDMRVVGFAVLGTGFPVVLVATGPRQFVALPYALLVVAATGAAAGRWTTQPLGTNSSEVSCAFRRWFGGGSEHGLQGPQHARSPTDGLLDGPLLPGGDLDDDDGAGNSGVQKFEPHELIAVHAKSTGLRAGAAADVVRFTFGPEFRRNAGSSDPESDLDRVVRFVVRLVFRDARGESCTTAMAVRLIDPTTPAELAPRTGSLLALLREFDLVSPATTTCPRPVTTTCPRPVESSSSATPLPVEPQQQQHERKRRLDCYATPGGSPGIGLRPKVCLLLSISEYIEHLINMDSDTCDSAHAVTLREHARQLCHLRRRLRVLSEQMTDSTAAETAGTRTPPATVPDDDDDVRGGGCGDEGGGSTCGQGGCGSNNRNEQSVWYAETLCVSHQLLDTIVIVSNFLLIIHDFQTFDKIRHVLQSASNNQSYEY